MPTQLVRQHCLFVCLLTSRYSSIKFNFNENADFLIIWLQCSIILKRLLHIFIYYLIHSRKLTHTHTSIYIYFIICRRVCINEVKFCILLRKRKSQFLKLLLAKWTASINVSKIIFISVFVFRQHCLHKYSVISWNYTPIMENNMMNLQSKL